MGAEESCPIEATAQTDAVAKTPPQKDHRKLWNSIVSDLQCCQREPRRGTRQKKLSDRRLETDDDYAPWSKDTDERWTRDKPGSALTLPPVLPVPTPQDEAHNSCGGCSVSTTDGGSSSSTATAHGATWPVAREAGDASWWKRSLGNGTSASLDGALVFLSVDTEIGCLEVREHESLYPLTELSTCKERAPADTQVHQACNAGGMFELVANFSELDALRFQFGDEAQRDAFAAALDELAQEARQGDGFGLLREPSVEVGLAASAPVSMRGSSGIISM